MLLTITTTHRPATDLGFLLHKHPDRVQTFSAGFGNAHVFYPEATEDRCTVALVNVFKSAMAGTCKGYEELAAGAIPLEFRLFVDPQFPDWGTAHTSNNT